MFATNEFINATRNLSYIRLNKNKNIINILLQDGGGRHTGPTIMQTMPEIGKDIDISSVQDNDDKLITIMYYEMHNFIELYKYIKDNTEIRNIISYDKNTKQSELMTDDELFEIMAEAHFIYNVLYKDKRIVGNHHNIPKKYINTRSQTSINYRVHNAVLFLQACAESSSFGYTIMDHIFFKKDDNGKIVVPFTYNTTQENRVNINLENVGSKELQNINDLIIEFEHLHTYINSIILTETMNPNS